jgi:hypothetical protein
MPPRGRALSTPAFPITFPVPTPAVPTRTVFATARAVSHRATSSPPSRVPGSAAPDVQVAASAAADAFPHRVRSQ